jgi:LacI family transcriptional regulator
MVLANPTRLPSGPRRAPDHVFDGAPRPPGTLAKTLSAPAASGVLSPVPARNPKRRNVLLISTWYEQDVIAGIASFARDAGWILRDVSRSPHFPNPWNGDGIIAYVRPWDTTLANALRAARKPVVNLAHDPIPRLRHAQVLPDNVAIGRLGATHLLERGYRDLAFFSWMSKPRVVRERLAGFRTAAREQGVEPVALAYDKGEGLPDLPILAWLCAEIQRLPKPLGLMVHYDVEADFVLHACAELGLRIPDDVAIVSVDNDYVHCELGLVPLTSIDCNFPMIGYRAAELLQRIMDGAPEPEEPVRVPPREIVQRQSSDALKVRVEPLRKALLFIKDHFDSELTADGVARAAGVSRRQLYRLFEDHLQRSVHREILNRRIEHARHLLNAGDDKIDLVAHYSGFGSAEQFSKTFRREVGMTPSEFRRQGAKSGPGKT